MNSYARRYFIAAALAAPCAPAGAQVVDGGFESGALAPNWTAGGTARVAIVGSANFTGGTVTPPSGSRIAILATGPGNAGGAAQRYDANTTDDFDLATLSQSVTWPDGPAAVLAFDWNFPSSEQDQQDQFDDLFDVRIGTTPVYSGSACKNNGSSFSNFPNVACTGLAQATWTVTGAAAGTTVNTQLRFGVGAWRHACVAIPGLVAGPNTFSVRFAALDQGDNSFDSALLLDNVEVRGACDATPTELLRQVTDTPSAFGVEVKGGAFFAYPIESLQLATDATGGQAAFVSSANLTGDNPNVIPQVFLWNGASFSRVTALVMTSDGAIDGVDMSDPTDAAINGRYLAISARRNAPAADNLEIYLYDRSTATLQAVTNTTGCDNTQPSIANNGTRIAFRSTCNAITGAGTTAKVVYAQNATPGAGAWTTTAFMGTTAGCIGEGPAISKSATGGTANGRYVFFESNCNLVAGNADGNREIYRYDSNGAGSLRQVTSTSGAVFNSGASTSASNGQFVWFTSNGEVDNATAGAQNADGSFEVFRADANVATPTVTQLTNETGGLAGPGYPRVRASPTGNEYAFERLQPLQLLSEVGRRTNTTFANAAPALANERVVAIGPPPRSLEFGRDASNVPQLLFSSDGDFLGSNVDGNPEIYFARVQ